MAWIKSHSVLIDHNKVRDIARVLNIKPVYLIGHLHCFWHKVIELKEDGDISAWTEEDIAYYARWDDDPKEFYEALKNRFIDEYDDNIAKKNANIASKNAIQLKIKVVHDWLDYAWNYLYSKYHTSNPNVLKKIEKKHIELEKIKGRPKGRPKGSPEVSPDKIDKIREDKIREDVNISYERDVLLERFQRFWKEYPRKIGKGNAERAWSKIKPGEQLTAAIVAAVLRAKTSVQWTKDHGQFIPHPATWLNRKGWEDEHDSGTQEDRYSFLQKGN